MRELEQESGLVGRAEDLSKIAVCYFTNTKSDGTQFVAKVHIYRLDAWEGEARATEEMAEPTFFPIDNLPYESMMLADKEWVPRALAGGNIVVHAAYGPFQKELLSPVVIEDAGPQLHG